MKTNIVFVTTEVNDVPKIISNSTISATLWFSGCHGKCKNCQNMALQLPCPGYNLKEITKELIERRHLCDWMVLCGGEPLMNYNINIAKDVINIAKKLKYKVMIYTGYEYDKIKNELSDIEFDYIKCGKYNETLENKDYMFASTNQYLIDSMGKRVYHFKDNRIIINT